jgi:hypothetical protein
LCCRLEKIIELDKPRNTWCKNCTIGKGCNVYPDRPNSCKAFECVWLKNPDLPDALRPDRIGVYGVDSGDYVKLVADDWSDFDTTDLEALMGDRHAILLDGDTIQFLCGKGKERPQRLTIDWIL